MDDVEALRLKASALRAEADALTGAYRRATWWRFTLVFFPVPFVLVLLRLEIESWTYYIFGGAYLGFSALLYIWDSRASDKCDEADRAAIRARQDYEIAMQRGKHAASS
jgi:hypothetical protein